MSLMRERLYDCLLCFAVLASVAKWTYGWENTDKLLDARTMAQKRSTYRGFGARWVS